LNKQADGIIPFGLRIKWTSTDEISSTIQNDEVILVLKENNNSDKNIVDAFILFVSKALLPKGRVSIDRNILREIDLYSIKNVILRQLYFCI
jgi:hypothetical protein